MSAHRADHDGGPPRRRGRPSLGPATSLRLPPPLRAALDAARRAPAGRRGQESMADAARRLLAVALDPVVADALDVAAAVWDSETVVCLDCPPAGSCARHSAAADQAEAARALLSALQSPIRK